MASTSLTTWPSRSVQFVEFQVVARARPGTCGAPRKPLSSASSPRDTQLISVEQAMYPTIWAGFIDGTGLIEVLVQEHRLPDRAKLVCFRGRRLKAPRSRRGMGEW